MNVLRVHLRRPVVVSESQKIIRVDEEVVGAAQVAQVVDRGRQVHGQHRERVGVARRQAAELEEGVHRLQHVRGVHLVVVRVVQVALLHAAEEPNEINRKR